MRLLSGQRAFVLQRLSALVLLAYLTAAALRLAFGQPPSVERWQAWVAQPLGAALVLLGGAAMLLHAWVGARDVVLDYVHPPALRLGALFATGLALGLLAAWTLLIVLRHAL
jgi:succinate dehydrogenase / fumarate reductase membrane anchor subunit